MAEIQLLAGFLRESDEPSVIVRTTAVKWAAFIAGAKAGEFDL